MMVELQDSQRILTSRPHPKPFLKSRGKGLDYYLFFSTGGR